jgi:type I restriction enzyme S subunit
MSATAVQSREPSTALPPGWRLVPIDEVCETVRPIAPKQVFSDHFRYIDIGAIENGEIVGARLISVSDAPSRARLLVQSGDTLLSTVRVYLRNLAYVDEDFAGAMASNGFCLLRPKEGKLHPRYLHHFVQCEAFVQLLIPLQRGNSPPAVLEDDIRAQLIPVGPYDEQRRVATRIDSMFEQVREGEAELAKARELLGVYRQSVLKAAVTGEMTAEWRSRNIQEETGADVVARIATRRRGDASRPRRRRTESEITIDERQLPTLPEGWVWSSVGTIADVIGGLTKNKGRKRPGSLCRPFLRVANVYADEFRLDEVHEIDVQPTDLARVEVRKGDLLVVEGNGSVDQIGRVAMWEGHIDGAVHQNHLIKVRIEPERLARFALVWMLSPHGRHFIEAVASSSSGLHTLSIGKIQSLPIPIPPEAEIDVILGALERQSVQRNHAAEAVEQELNRAQAIRQAVLHAAFSGNLVPPMTTDAATS